MGSSTTPGSCCPKAPRCGMALIGFLLLFAVASCGGGGGGGGAESPTPSAVTLAADNVTIDNAVLKGIVNSNGLAAQAWFEWGTDNSSLTERSPDIQVGSGTTDNQVVFIATGLQPKTTYHFRIAAISSAGEAAGEIKSFQTPPLPTVTTLNASGVTTGSASLNGTVNPNGLATYAWFEWGTDSELETFSATDNSPIGNGTGILERSETIAVSAGVTYYYRIAASNPEGVSRGDIAQFRAYQLPDVVTGSATSIALDNADLNGTVNPSGYETHVWFEYGTDPSLSTPYTTDNQLIGSQSTILEFSGNVAGLTPYTTWYFRAVAQNVGGTRKGAIQSFPTGRYFIAVGDSITEGIGDTDNTDGTGYEPVLDGLLDGGWGYPVTVMNEGVGGDTTSDGVSRIGPVLAAHPDANYVLILYGTNDSDSLWGDPVESGLGLSPGDPGYAGSFKANMQAIVSAVIAAGKIPCLAKVPYSTVARYDTSSIQEYNQVIDGLVAANSIPTTPPDFYSWFYNHPGELADGVHPNGAGYRSMADLWFSALTQ